MGTEQGMGNKNGGRKHGKKQGAYAQAFLLTDKKA